MFPSVGTSWFLYYITYYTYTYWFSLYLLYIYLLYLYLYTYTYIYIYIIYLSYLLVLILYTILLILLYYLVLILIWYRGSHLKDASCSPHESLTRLFSPIICLGSVVMDLISNWGGE